MLFWGGFDIMVWCVRRAGQQHPAPLASFRADCELGSDLALGVASVGLHTSRVCEQTLPPKRLGAQLSGFNHSPPSWGSQTSLAPTFRLLLCTTAMRAPQG